MVKLPNRPLFYISLRCVWHPLSSDPPSVVWTIFQPPSLSRAARNDLRWFTPGLNDSPSILPTPAPSLLHILLKHNRWIEGGSLLPEMPIRSSSFPWIFKLVSPLLVSLLT